MIPVASTGGWRFGVYHSDTDFDFSIKGAILPYMETVPYSG